MVKNRDVPIERYLKVMDQYQISVGQVPKLLIY
jgi:hypothetical protein